MVLLVIVTMTVTLESVTLVIILVSTASSEELHVVGQLPCWILGVTSFLRYRWIERKDR